MDEQDPGRPPTCSVLIVGAGGLLGSAVAREYSRRGFVVTAARVTWSEPDVAAADLHDQLAHFVSTLGESPWRLVWAAGAGVTASSSSILDAEADLQRAVVDELTALPYEVRTRGAVFYSSSAGGVYAGSVGPPFSEATTATPLSAYGWAKLRSESTFATLTAADVPVAIGRLANIYGPGQNLAKPQGLISQLCYSFHSSVPVNIYVSLDTLRDYVFVDDAAQLVIDFVEQVALMPPEDGAITKVLASGRSVSLAALLGELKRISKHRVPVVLAASPHAKQQARDLRVRSIVLPELDRRVHVPLAVGVAATEADIGARFRAPRRRPS